MAEDFAPISLDTTTQTPTYPPISISTGIQTSPLTPEVADFRSRKATYGLADVVSTDYNEFYRRFINGQELQVRKEAASMDDHKRLIVMNETIRKIASERNQPLSMDESAEVQSVIKSWKPSDPTSIIEDAFSVKAINNIYTVNGGMDSTEDRPYSWLEDAMREIPKQVASTVRTASAYTSKIELAKTLRQNLQSEIDNQSTIGWTLDQAKTFFQPYMEAKLRGNVPIDVWGGLGTSKEEQAKVLLRMEPDEYKKRLVAIVNDLKKDNPTIAAAFLEGVIGQSISEARLDNVFTTLSIPDLYTGGKIGASLLKKAVLFNDVRATAKSMVRNLQETGDKQPIKVAVADAAGDLSEAAIQKEVQNVSQAFKGSVNPEKEAVEALTDVMRTDVENFTARPGRYGQEIVNRLRESYDAFRTNLFDTIERVAKVERITPALATEAGIKAIQQELKEAYPGLSNSIINVSAIYKNPLTNTYHADLIIARPDGTYFLHKETAEAFSNFNGLKGITIKNDGAGYYIAMPKPVNETTHAVRDFITATAASKSPNSWLSAFAGMLRTPEETLAREQLLNRKIATYAPSELMKVAKETAKDIENLSKFTLPGTNRRHLWNDWERTVKYAQEARDPITKEKGYFFQSPAELEQFYQKTFQRLPEIQEIEAYYAFKRLGEMDHVMRNLSVYRNMSRVGAQNHVLQVFDRNDIGHRVKSGTFQGVTRKEFPGGEGTGLLLGERQGMERLWTEVQPLSGRLLKEIREGVKKGEYKVIELFDPELRPLTGFSPGIKDERIRWVVVKAGQAEESALNYSNLPYKGGGHFEYDYEHYIKQARIRPERVGKSFKNWYEGDNTVMPISIRAMGHDVAKKLNEVRLLIKNRDIAGAKEAAKKLPMEWNEVYSWFRPGRDPNGNKLTPRLNLNEPFVVVERNRKIIDIDKEALENRYFRNGKTTLEDGTRKGSLARQYQVEYTGERDVHELFTLRNEGTAANPLYKIEDPKLLDPIPVMNRAVSRITNSFFMDDYKISAIEHWLREASPFLKAGEDELRYAPFHHFNNLSKDSWKKGAAPEMVSQLTTRYNQIRQFTGVASDTEALLHSFAQKLSDSIYTKFGEAGLGVRGFKLDPVSIASRIDDPVKFVRSVTFHAKLGLFAIPQFLVQSQTFATILGVAGPKRAVPGTFATILHQMSRINPNMIESLDKYASRFHIPGTSRWRPGEFKEAWEELRNTGFANVGGEYALRDDLMSHKVISTGKDKFLDAGTFFFKEGEKNVRLGAWYTAYREFRDANPLGKITDVNRREILDRAALLNVNMDRSSNSVLQHGAFSIPTQFLTYQIRAAELFLGKRLSMVERSRLFATYSALYGVPTATGVLGYPFGDNIRKSAIDNGIELNSSWISAVMNGLPAAMLQAATGNLYNIGERYGNQGFTSIRDALQGDKTLWDIMGGAAFSTLTNTWTHSDGFRTAMMSFLRDDPGFKMRSEDAVDIFKEISSVNAAWRGWAAINTGRWLTKMEGYQTDVTPANAVFQTITGLQDQKIADTRQMQLIRKDEKALADYSEKKAIEEFQRGLRTMNDDPKQAKDLFSRSFSWLKIGGFPENRYSSVIAKASKDNESIIARTKWEFFLGKDVPATKSRGPFGIFGTRENVPLERAQQFGRDIQKGQP